MKKNLIALSVAAMVGGLGLSTGAHADVVPGAAVAQQFTGDGIGHALLIPYYTVQNGNVSIFSIINTDTVNGKAVKIRFRGASNSDDVFDFQVYMSPGDVFTGAVSQGAGGTAQFTTADNSCTLPASVNQSFVTTRLSAAEQVGGAGTREGYIEIFTMADIEPTEATTGPTGTDINLDADELDANPLFTAIKHVDGVAPCGLASGALATKLSTNTDAAITLADTAGNNANAHVKGLDFPTASLVGGWTIINVDEALSFSGNATTVIATDGAAAPSAAAGNIVFWPQRDFTVGGTSEVALALDIGGNPAINAFSADPLLKLGGTAAGITAGGVEPRAYDLPDMSTPYIVYSAATAGASTAPGAAAGRAVAPWEQAFSLTGALAVTTITNEYATDADIAAASDWTFSMPSRRYNTAVRYLGTGAPRAVYTDFEDGTFGDGVFAAAIGGDTFAVATDALGDVFNYFTPTNTDLSGTQLCVLNVSQAAFDREETSLDAPTDFVISPSTPGDPVAFCGEASVLSFNAGGTSSASVLGAALARQDIDVTFTNGYAVLGTPGLTTKGLPVTGAFFLKAVNPLTAAGTAANYGASWAHRVTRP